MKSLIYVAVLFYSLSSFSQTTPPSIQLSTERAKDELIKAITICTAPNHPVENGLKVLGANLFENVSAISGSTGAITITAEAVSSLNSVNKAILAADVIRGSITIVTEYVQSGPMDVLYTCTVTANPAPTGR